MTDDGRVRTDGYGVKKGGNAVAPLDWIQKNRERVEALAESDRRTAPYARTLLAQLNGDGDEEGEQ